MSKFSVRQPITVLMGTLIIIVLGVFSLTKLPMTFFPDIELPYLVTVTTFEEASPDEVQREVTSKIESAVQQIGNFSDVQSISYEHFSMSIVTFAARTDMNSAHIELSQQLDNISFPEGVKPGQILRISPDMLPVLTVSMFKDFEDDTLSDEDILIKTTEWIKQDVVDNLKSVEGVAEVNILGAADVVLQIQLDTQLLQQYGLSNEQVLGIINEQNVGGLAGVALDDGEIRMLYIGDKVTSLEELKQTPITYDGTSVITLAELSGDKGISFIDNNDQNYSKINNQQGIVLSIQGQTNYGVTEVSDNITKRINEITSEDQSVSYTVIVDQGDYIKLAINSVVTNLIVGGLLAIGILYLFLRDIKPTIIVGLSIPISVIASFVLMYFLNISLNVVSMGGLALGIGMLVDNSIVVIENIYRMISEGKSRREAAIYGAKQVSSSIISSTLTTVAVFLPIVFIEGLIADVFMSMAYTIAFSLGSSLVIALTLVPSMASKMLDDKKEYKEAKVLTKLKELYENILNFILRFRVSTLLIVLLLLALTSGIVISKGFILLPETDEGSISLNLEFDSKVTFESKAEFTDELTRNLLEYSDIETVSASINAGSMMSMLSLGSSDDVSINLNLSKKRKKSTKDYELIIENLIEEFDYSEIDGISSEDLLDVTISGQNSAMALTGGQGISVKVSGPDLYNLEKIAGEVTEILKTNNNLTKITDGINRGEDNVQITVNKSNAIKHGLTATDVNNSLSYLFTGLSNLISSSTVNVTLDNITYNISIPSASLDGVDFDILGNYEQFLSGVLTFDKETQYLIDEYIAENPDGIYGINLLVGDYQFGDPIAFVVNPNLYVVGEKIVLLDGAKEGQSLRSLAVGPLIDETTDSIAEVNYITGFSSINTDGNTFYITAKANVAEGKNVTLVGDEVTKLINDYVDSDEFKAYGSSYKVELVGESEEIMKAVKDLAIAAVVAILLVYMIMAIQFQSLLYPLIIIATIPLAFTGGMLALLITRMHLSMVSIMGLIILVGVVVNNGIVLVDYINQLRAEGKSIRESILEAGKTRMRPIFMTALTTILGLGMMAFGVGEGGELLQPMAITAIGGLFYATILTLFVVPAIYALFNNKKIKEEEQVNVE